MSTQVLLIVNTVLTGFLAFFWQTKDRVNTITKLVMFIMFVLNMHGVFT